MFERVRRGGAAGSLITGGGYAWGGVRAPPFAGSGLIAGRVGPVRRRRWGLGGLTWCSLVLGGGGEVSHSPWMCRVGVWHRLRWMQRRWWQVVRVQSLSWGGGGGGGPLRRRRGGPADKVLRVGGDPSGRRGSWVERLAGAGAIPCAGAVRAVGVVPRWGRVAGSRSDCGGGSALSSGGGGGGGGDEGAGSAGAGGDGDVAVDMLLGSLSIPPGLGSWALFAAPGAVRLGDRGRGVPFPWFGLAGGGGGLWGLDGGALGDKDVDEGLDGAVLCGRLRGNGSRWGEGGPGCGGHRVLAWVWVRVWVRVGPLLLPSRLL